MAKKLNIDLTINADMKVSDIEKQIKRIESLLSGKQLGRRLSVDLKNTLIDLRKNLDDFRKKASEGITSAADVKTLDSQVKKVYQGLNRLQSVIRNIEKVDPGKLVPDFKLRPLAQANEDLDDFSRQLEEIRKEQSSFLEQQRTFASEIEKEIATIEEKRLKAQDLESRHTKVIREAREAQRGLNEESEKYKELQQTIARRKSVLTMKQGEIRNLTADLVPLNSQLKEIKDRLNFTPETNEFREKLATNLRVSLDDIPKSLEGISKYIDDLTAGHTKDVVEDLKDINTALGEAAGQYNNVRKEVNGAAEAVDQILDKEKELESIYRRMTYFFTAANGIRLFRQAVRSAIKVVRDLDKAMTNAAVVTEFTVSEMWQMLPTYTKMANELGATTLGAYEVSTLFYQQGLQTQQAFELSIATMKLARVANLDYAQSADLMTSALRGFHMELNEINANRVLDVYAAVAARSASDVRELSIAMSKVASLAHSVGMDFETTTVFLGQAIEATREPAESIGTALTNQGICMVTYRDNNTLNCWELLKLDELQRSW